jgi:hypothetical protein
MKRWVVLLAPWYQCIAAGLPYLRQPGDGELFCEPHTYCGPPEGCTDIILGPTRFPYLTPVFNRAPERTFFYETENVLYDGPWRRRSADLRRACPKVAWLNYSDRNAEVFGDLFAPLRRIHAPKPRPTAYQHDVLFVGSLNERRTQLLWRLKEADVAVRVHDTIIPIFGADLEAAQQQARLVLNVHYYIPGVFESFRVVPAVHCGARVLSERSEGDEGAEWCETARYGELFERTMQILGQDKVKN